MSIEQLSFTHVQPLKDIDVNGVRLFDERYTYQVIETYQRGSYTIDGNHMYFAQTTLAVINMAGEKTYIPYTSGNFSKIRGTRTGAAV